MFRSIQKNIFKPTLIIAGILIAGGAATSAVSAVTFSQDVGVSFTFNPSIAVTLSSNDLIIPNLTPGTASDSNIINVNVKTNNITGYTLNATVGDNTTFNTRDLINQNSNVTDKFSSVAFGTIVANNTVLGDNTWGYSYSLDDGTSWIANTASSTSAGYSGLPLYSDTVNVAKLKETTGPAATNAGDDIKFKIAARASNEIASGEYNNVINFTAVANPEPSLAPVECESGKICYNANSIDPDAVEGTMGKQTTDDVSGNTITGNMSVMLLASNFSREGYGFAGWSDAYDYETNQNAHFYGPQETITTPSDMSDGLSLYAVWVPSEGYMQNWTGCYNLANNEVTALTDARDNQTYAVAKLTEDGCWMIENLRLNDEYTTRSGDAALSQGYYAGGGSYGSFIGLANSESANFNSNVNGWGEITGNSIYGNVSSNPQIDISILNSPYARIPRYNNTNTTNRATNPTSNVFGNSTSGGMYSYGNYYNYAASMASTNNIYNTNVVMSTGSICPTGWIAPSSQGLPGPSYWDLLVNRIAQGVQPESYTDQQNLYNQHYATSPLLDEVRNTMMSYPYNFLYSGRIDDNLIRGRGGHGRYWTRAINNGNEKEAYIMGLQSTRVFPGTYSFNKYIGMSIRCIIEE